MILVDGFPDWWESV